MYTMPIPTIKFLVTQLLSFMNCVSTSHFCIFITMEFLSFGYYNVSISPSQWSFCLPTIPSLLKYSATYLSCIVPPHLNCNATSRLYALLARWVFKFPCFIFLFSYCF
jgi:hypothetical protein